MATAVKKMQLPETITLLDKGCEFQGKLSFEGVVRIDGAFHGEIFSQDHLIIGEGAQVEATIQVGTLEVGGTFKGKLIARDRLIVHPTGRIQGEIKTKDLEVQLGAAIDGKLEMESFRHTKLDQQDEIPTLATHGQPKSKA
jgi:cytoskeletal protein CcmA (bactofilin family)